MVPVEREPDALLDAFARYRPPELPRWISGRESSEARHRRRLGDRQLVALLPVADRHLLD